MTQNTVAYRKECTKARDGWSVGFHNISIRKADYGLAKLDLRGNRKLLVYLLGHT